MDLHQDLVERANSLFQIFGYETILEDELPNGKGASDIIARKLGHVPLVCEVKSSPTSPKSKKVLKQMQKYQSHYGTDYSYLLISPDVQGEISVATMDGTYRGKLLDFLD